MQNQVNINIPRYLAIFAIYVKTGGHNVFTQPELREHLECEYAQDNKPLIKILDGDKVGAFFTSQATNLNNLLDADGDIKYVPDEVWDILYRKELFITRKESGKNKYNFTLVFDGNDSEDNLDAKIIHNFCRMSGINKQINDSASGIIPSLIEEGVKYGVLELIARNNGPKDDYDVRQSVATQTYHFYSYDDEINIVKKFRANINFSDLYGQYGQFKSHREIFHIIMDIVQENEIVRALREYNITPNTDNLWRYLTKNVKPLLINDLPEIEDE